MYTQECVCTNLRRHGSVALTLLPGYAWGARGEGTATAGPAAPTLPPLQYNAYMHIVEDEKSS